MEMRLFVQVVYAYLYKDQIKKDSFRPNFSETGSEASWTKNIFKGHKPKLS